MTLRGITIPNLLGGVSQQPEDRRFPNQADESLNAYPSLIEGLKKRPPCEHVAQMFNTFGSGDKVSTHVIKRSPTEQYIIGLRQSEGQTFAEAYDLVNKRKVDVYDRDRKLISSSRLSYFDDCDVSTDASFVSVADYTWALNREKVVRMDPARSPETIDEALVTVVQGNYGSKYSIIIDGQRYTLGTDSETSTTYANGRTPTNDREAIGTDAIARGLQHGIIAQTGIDSGMHLSRNNDTSFKLTSPRAIDGSFKLELELRYSKAPESKGLIVRTPFLSYDCTRTDIRNALADAFDLSTTYNRSNFNGWQNNPVFWTVTGDYRIGAGAVPGSGARTEDGIDFAFDLSKAYTKEDHRDKEYDAIGIKAKIVEDKTRSLDVSGAGIQVRQHGATLHIRKQDGGPFTIDVEDSNSGSDLKVVKDSVREFTDLPRVSTNGFNVRVEGNPEENLDDYYLTFESTSLDGMGDGRWVESVGPDLERGFDPDTTPHVFTSYIDDEDGTVTGTAYDPYFVFGPFALDARAAGDEDTNRNPSFVDDKIRAIALHRARLCFISGESLAASEANQYSNFWRTTATNLLDTDRIDVTAATDKVSLFERATTLNNDIILYSGQTQFRFDSGQELMSPKTAALTKLGSFDCDTSVTPVGAGRYNFFPFNRGGFTNVSQFANASGGSNPMYQGDEITEQIPQYIPGSPTHMAVSQAEGLIAMSTDSSSTIYMHKYADSGNDRVQSSWFKCDISADSIESLGFIDSKLYITTRRGDRIYVEAIEFAEGAVITSDVGFTAHLDRFVKHTDCDVLYMSTSDETVVTTPYVDLSNVAAVEYDETGATSGIVHIAKNVFGDRAVFNGDLSAKKMYIGQLYTMEHKIAPMHMFGNSRVGGYAPLLTGRTKIRYIYFDLEETGFLRAVVEDMYRDDSTVEFSANQVLVGSSKIDKLQLQDGRLKVPLFLGGQDYTVSLKNDTALPCRVIAGEALVKHGARSKRFG